MKITVYSTETCSFCRMLKKYLEEQGIKYDEKMADQDENAAEELYKNSHGFTVPFTIIERDDGQIDSILGFDIQRINAALGIS